ncbi:MAG: aminotransferase class I/II-fold pyridoxal phosphate-dependent enzyme [Desulfopila sp.]|jgi:methionine-gamma-lyase|nr:aminotransferase class I/II-fold pyridoxal phosphate-dependent enzyme [Desulfopila sp.]
MVSRKTDLHEDTHIVHGLRTIHTTSMDLVPPIHMTSTFSFKNQQHGADVFAGVDEGFLYTRIGNPTVAQLQEKMAMLEGCEEAIAVASGMAATASVVMSLARPGDNIVACNALYGGTFALFHDHLPEFSIESRFLSPADSNDGDRVASMVDNKTRLLYLETPANPTLAVIDIALWADIAHTNRIPLVVDNTFASTYLQKPARMGADIVVHSATKYLGGHGDIIGGIIVTSKELVEVIRKSYFHHFGPTMSPFNAWLILRGLKTLALRMQRHCASAQHIAQWLETQPAVEHVHYPGLPSHAQHQLASRQMKGFSGIVAFELKSGVEGGKKVMDAVKLCKLAVSLGDCETLIQHPASMTHSTYGSRELAQAGITEGLVRLSVGLEDPADIVADLEQALEAAK